MNTIPTEFADDYAMLGAPANCDLEQLRLHYRRSVREVHPDLHPALADDPAAQERLRALNAAMARLEEHQRLNGRLPLQPLRQATPAPIAAPAAGLATSGNYAYAARESASIRTGGIKWLLVSSAVALGIWALAPEPAKPPPPKREDRGPPAAGRELAAAPKSTAERRRALATGFGVRIGDDKHRVKVILGAPILVTGDVWEYGPSHVIFRDEHVVDWYSSPLKPISVDESSRLQGGY
jgi:hypothetical protein